MILILSSIVCLFLNLFDAANILLFPELSSIFLEKFSKKFSRTFVCILSRIPIRKNPDGIRQVVHGFLTGKDPVGIDRMCPAARLYGQSTWFRISAVVILIRIPLGSKLGQVFRRGRVRVCACVSFYYYTGIKNKIEFFSFFT